MPRKTRVGAAQRGFGTIEEDQRDLRMRGALARRLACSLCSPVPEYSFHRLFRRFNNVLPKEAVSLGTILNRTSSTEVSTDVPIPLRVPGDIP